MPLSFHANCVAIDDMEECWLVGFADDKFDTRQYLILERAYEDEEQDIRQGMDTYYVERDGQQWSMYGQIQRCELHRDHIIVQFSEQGIKRMETDEIRISYKLDDATFTQLQDRLNHIFSGAGCYCCRG